MFLFWGCWEASVLRINGSNWRLRNCRKTILWKWFVILCSSLLGFPQCSGWHNPEPQRIAQIRYSFSLAVYWTKKVHHNLNQFHNQLLVNKHHTFLALNLISLFQWTCYLQAHKYMLNTWCKSYIKTSPYKCTPQSTCMSKFKTTFIVSFKISNFFHLFNPVLEIEISRLSWEDNDKDITFRS